MRTWPSHSFFCEDADEVLDELHYKDMANHVEKNSVAGAHLSTIATRDWAPLVPYVKYGGHKDGTFKFVVPGKYNTWETYVQFAEWDQVVEDSDLTPPEGARMLLWVGNLRLHCTCPSYLFHGYQYVLTQLDAAIFPEKRYPSIRNPQLAFGPCKHCRRMIRVLPWHLGEFAQAIKETRSGAKTKKSSSSTDQE